MDELTRSPGTRRGPIVTVIDMVKSWSAAQRFAMVVVAVALLGIGVVVLGSGDDAPGTSAAGNGTTGAEAVDAPGARDGAAAEVAGNGAALPVEGDQVAESPPSVLMLHGGDVPVEVEISPTRNLGDGDTVHLEVTPRGGTQIYGAEARLCRDDAVIEFDADRWPEVKGLCIPEPLSAASDALVEAAASPPYEMAALDFRVGVGSRSWTLDSGEATTLTCGPSNPCSLVVKFQIPNGYGFRSYPVTFA